MKNLRASIDIGSNSILLLAGQWNEDHTFKECLNESRITGLGRDLDRTKNFSELSMQDSYNALQEFKILLEKFQIKAKDVLVTATEASRVALNSQVFYQKIKKDFDFSVNIISGAGEAYYAALGVSLSISKKNNLITMMDVGGASTELIKVQLSPFKILNTISLPMGSVRALSWSQQNEFEANLNKILNSESNSINDFKSEKILAIAGTMTTLAAMYLKLSIYDDRKVNGVKIKIEEFSNLIDNYKNVTPAQLLEKFTFLGKRSQTVMIGGELALRLASVLGTKELTVSTFGLRYGTLFEGDIKNEFITWKPK